jgi:hypothetical protein
METMNIALEKKLSDRKRIGIVRAKEWFKDVQDPNAIPSHLTFVVGEWHDYHDGIRSHIEGRVTVAICKDYVDALTIFASKKREEKG